MAVFFAVAIILALGFMCTMVQSNSIASTMSTAIGVGEDNKQLVQMIIGIVLVVLVGFIFLGSILSNDLVWELADTFNFLMVIPNAIALIALAGVVATISKASKNKDKQEELRETLDKVEKTSIAE